MSSCVRFRSDLAKAASTLYMHNLTGVLETAIRATNAQYADPEIIERLDCRLLEVRFTQVSRNGERLNKKTRLKTPRQNVYLRSFGYYALIASAFYNVDSALYN